MWLRRAFVPLLLGSAITCSARASTTVVDLGVEGGTLPPWDAVGTARVESFGFGVDPAKGDYQLLVSSHDPGSSGVQTARLEASLKLKAGALNGLAESGGVVQGSAVQRTFKAVAGDTLSFFTVFLTNEERDGPNPDFAFYALDGNVKWITSASNTPLPSPNAEFGAYGFYVQQTVAIDSTGTHTLALGVVDVNDDLLTSGALFSQVELATSGGGTMIPLPPAMPTAGATLGVLLTCRMIRTRLRRDSRLHR